MVGIIESAGGFLISAACCFDGFDGEAGERVAVVGTAVIEGAPVEGETVGVSKAIVIETLEPSSSTADLSLEPSPSPEKMI